MFIKYISGPLCCVSWIMMTLKCQTSFQVYTYITCLFNSCRWKINALNITLAIPVWEMIKYIVCFLRNIRCRRWSNVTCFLIGVLVFIIGYYYWSIRPGTQVTSQFVLKKDLTSLAPLEDNYVKMREKDDGQVRKKRTVLSVPWELNDQNVRGYAIQGRRFSMEDRMEVVTNISVGNDLVNVYAVLDGHGGEVC